MNDILRIKRVDEDPETSWGNNISMIIATDSEEFTESLIEKYLLKDDNGKNVRLYTGSDKTLTRKHIQIEKLGTSNDIKPDLLLIVNAGA